MQVQKDFEELPLEAALSLRDSVIKLVCEHNRAKTVRTQLCLAMASIAVFLEASHFGNEGIIVWMYTKLNAENPSLAVTSMLELLAVLPQVRTLPLPPANTYLSAHVRWHLPDGCSLGCGKRAHGCTQHRAQMRTFKSLNSC